MPKRTRSRIYWAGGARGLISGITRASAGAGNTLSLPARSSRRLLHGASRARVTLGQYASEHLVKKAETGKFNPRWLRLCELHLTRACEFFGAGRPMWPMCSGGCTTSPPGPRIEVR
jgi:hypothetical protein